jgi:hypothetical protein
VLLFLLVCALHGVLGWFLLAASRVLRLNTHASGFELLMLAPAPVSFPNVRPQSGPPRAVSRTAQHRVVETKKDVDPSTPSNAITPPIDWNAEISRAGRAASGLDPKNPVKDFGFPKTPPTMADYPQFDWDYARTHRVESIPEGGVVIHLNDNCMLVLNPFPFPFCWPFKRAANGELFKHMLDPDNSGDARLP